MAAPTLVATYKVALAQSTATLSTSVTVANGDLLVVMATAESGQVLFTGCSGGGLTYTQRQYLNTTTSASNPQAICWTAPSTSAQTFTLSVTQNGGGGSSGNHVSLIVYRFSSHGGYGGSAATINGGSAPSLAYTTTGANSALVFVNSDWNCVNGSSRTYRTVNGITPAAGGSGEDDYGFFTGSTTYEAAHYSDAGAAGAKTVGLTAPTSEKPGMIVVEVLAASSGTNVTVTGVTATATATAPAGTVTAQKNVALSGPVATAAAAAPAGTVHGSAVIAGPVATAAATAQAGAVAAGGSIVVAGPTAASFAIAPPGAVTVAVPEHLPNTAWLGPQPLATAKLLGTGDLPLLVDGFTVARNDLWSYIGNLVTFDGAAHLQAEADYSQALISADSWDLRSGGSASVQVVSADVADTGVETWISLKDPAHDSTRTLEFLIEGGAGTLSAVYKPDSTSVTTAASTTYDPAMHRWLRIRLEGTSTVHWETSPDRQTWASLATWTATWPLSQLELVLSAGFWSTAPGSPAFSVFDNAQVLAPPIGVGTGDGTSTAPLSSNGASIARPPSDGTSSAVVSTT